jgi:LysM repeat protein
LAVGRYVIHVVVLVFALALSGYASLPTGLNLRLGAVNAEGLVLGQGGQVGSVQLGRLSTVMKPVSVPTAAPVSHTPITYEVKDGDTLKDLAARFRVSVDDIRWSNYSALKSTSKDVTRGQKVVIPPVDGLVVTAKQGDTPVSLGNTYHASAVAIVDFNYLRTSDQDPIPAGMAVVIPGGRGPDFEKPAAAVRAGTFFGSYSGSGYSVFPFTGTYSVAPGNRFPYGFCTWYAYNRKPVPWNGNAWEWFGNAKAYGWATGQTPRPGAIMVTWESGFGHVAYVESVGADGSWTVSEMNFRGFALLDMRTIRPGGVPLLGFIY